MRSLLAITLLTLVAGCGEAQVAAPAGRSVAVGAGGPELSFPANWAANDKDHPFDLQWLSRDDTMTTGVFHWLRSDLAADLDGERLLQLQIEDMRGKRNRFTAMGARTTAEDAGRRLSTLVFSGEKGLSRYIYRFTLVELTEHPQHILVILQTAMPSRWSDAEPVLAAITSSVRRPGPAAPKR